MTPEELAMEAERTRLAEELEAMVAHSQEVYEAEAGSYVAGELLEDLEHRLTELAIRLRGREPVPFVYHHPMPGEE